VGVGCGVLALLAIASGVVAFVLAKRAASSGLAGAFSAAVELAVDGGAVSFDAGTEFDAGLIGGPTCERAADCCRRVLEKTGANPQTLAACEELRKANEVACRQALEVHRRSAPLLGTSCP
jgi:hypothetical protein